MRTYFIPVKSIVIRTILLFSVLIFSSHSRSQSPVDSSRIIRVLTYNIYHGETMRGDFNLDTIAGVIKSVNPDLVALQEVDFRTNRAKQMDLAMELGQRTGLIPLFGKAMPFSGGEYGEAILSRYTFLSTRNNALRAREGKEPRSALEVNVELGSGDIIRFIGTHLDHTRDETDRINMATELNDFFTGDDVPSILAGDLNARPESKTMGILLKEWTKSSTDNAPTSPSANPRAKIDYILFGPAIVFSHQSIESPNGGLANHEEIRKILEQFKTSSGQLKTIACLSGHHHADYVKEINGIPYIQINSMSYKWVGDEFEYKRFSPHIEQTYPMVRKTCPFIDPLYTILTLDPAAGTMQLEGRETGFIAPTPTELSIPNAEKMKPSITERFLNYNQ